MGVWQKERKVWEGRKEKGLWPRLSAQVNLIVVDTYVPCTVGGCKRPKQGILDRGCVSQLWKLDGDVSYSKK